MLCKLMLTELMSPELISGVIGAVVGAIAGFGLGLGREMYKEHKSQTQLIRRAQFTLMRQRNELKMLIQYMDGVRHLKDRHRKIPRTPFPDQLSQFKAEELDFLLEPGFISAQELVNLDLSNAAYVNARFVNEMRNELVQNVQSTATIQRHADQVITGQFNSLLDAQAAKLTDGLYMSLDDAIARCFASWDVLSKASKAIKMIPGEKCFEDVTPVISDLDWKTMRTVSVSSRQPQLKPLEGSRIFIFEDKADRTAAQQLDKAEQWLAANGRPVERVCIVIGGRTHSAVISELGMHDASELVRSCGLVAYYWLQEDVLSLVDPWHSRPSAKCEVSWLV